MSEKSRSRRLIGEGFWVVFGQLLTVIGSFVQVRVLTELIEPAEYGELQIALTISGLVTSTLMAAVHPGITRYYSISTEKGDTSAYLDAAKKLVAYASLAVLLVSFTFSIILVFLDLAHWILLTVIAFGVGLFSSYAGTIGSIQNAARQRVLVAVHNVANAWIKILFAVLFIYLLAGSSVSISIAIGFLLTAILVTISQVYFLKKLPRGQSAKDTLFVSEDWDNLILKFSRPFLIWGVFGWLQQSSSKWALGLFSTTEEVGLFTVLFQIGYAPVAMLSGLLMTFVTPIIYSRVGDATDTQRVNKVIKMLFLLSLISFALLCVMVLASELFKVAIFDLAVGEKFRTASNYLPFMVVAGGLFAIGLVIASIPAALNIPSKLLMPSLASSLIGIAGTFIGAYYYSFEGVVFSLLIHSISYLLLCCWSVLKIVRDDSRLSIV